MRRAIYASFLSAVATLTLGCTLGETGELLGGHPITGTGPEGGAAPPDATSPGDAAIALDGTAPRDATAHDASHDVVALDGGPPKDAPPEASPDAALLDSCNVLYLAGKTTSGAYTIQPASASSAFSVYCDMTDNGGGWTLVLKGGTVGSPGTFDYGADYWTTGTTLNPTSTDMTQTEAMFQSYGTVPFTSLLLMMEAIGSTSAPNMLQVTPPVTADSLLALMGSPTNTVLTSAGKTAWTGLAVPTAVIQTNCNMEGINIVTGAGGCVGPDGVSVRIGFIANDQDDCCSPNSYVGFGGQNQGDTDCTPVSYSVGSMEGVSAGDVTCTGGTANIQDFGFVFVR
jgi:Fibrinogen beta and gamma chains, C-terminal globular domain